MKTKQFLFFDIFPADHGKENGGGKGSSDDDTGEESDSGDDSDDDDDVEAPPLEGKKKNPRSDSFSFNDASPKFA